MSSRLPNPNMTHDEVSAVTLREALHHQKHTAIWSRNTDVNTFRGNMENKGNLEKISQQVMGTGTLLEDQHKDSQQQRENSSKTLVKGLERAFKVAIKPIRRLTVTLNDVKFSSFADSFSAGSERVNAGLKELTNGLGTLGPLINNFKTGMYKAVAVLNVIGGTLQMLFGGFVKVFKSMFGLKPSEEISSDELQTKIDETKSKRDEDAERHRKKMEALMVKLHPDSINALGAVMSGQGGYQKDLEEYRLEEEERKAHERKKEYDDEIYELEKKRQEALHREQNKRNIFSFLKIAVLIAAIVGIIFLLREKIGAVFKSVFDELKANGYFGAIGQAAAQFTTRVGSLFDELSKGLKNMFGGGTNTSPKGGGTNPKSSTKGVQAVGSGAGEGIEASKTPTILDSKGKPIVSEIKTPTTTTGGGTGNKVLTKTTKVLDGVSDTLVKLGPKIAVGGAALEGAVDAYLNEQRYNDIKLAYERQTPIERADGSFAPISESEMAGVENIMINNRAGSGGRAAGALAGGYLGAQGAVTFGAPAIAMSGPFAPVTATLLGLAGGIGGAIIGGMTGDYVATEASEAITGTDNSEVLLNSFSDSAENALEKQQSDLDKIRDAAKGKSSGNTAIDASTRNFLKQEAMFHGGNPHKKDQMIENSYMYHMHMMPYGF